MTKRALLPGYAFADEFEPGLSLVLDGLGRWLEDDRGSKDTRAV
jgi:hypothetical protein